MSGLGPFPLTPAERTHGGYLGPTEPASPLVPPPRGEAPHRQSLPSGVAERVASWLAGEGDPLPSNNTTLALANQLMVKSGAGYLMGITGFNNKISAQFIQVHDSSTIPGNGAVPVVVITVPTASNFSITYMPLGRLFWEGIAIVNSSTAATLTIGAADCWIDAQYI